MRRPTLAGSARTATWALALLAAVGAGVAAAAAVIALLFGATP